MSVRIPGDKHVAETVDDLPAIHGRQLRTAVSAPLVDLGQGTGSFGPAHPMSVRYEAVVRAIQAVRGLHKAFRFFLKKRNGLQSTCRTRSRAKTKRPLHDGLMKVGTNAPSSV